MKYLIGFLLCLILSNYSFVYAQQDAKFSEYQKELRDRVELPYEILSDVDFTFTNALKLPTFEASGMKLQKRLTLIIKDGVIVKHHYPVFPSNKDVDWVISSLKALA